MQRQFDPNEPELMDRPQPVSDELREDLACIEWLNRTFGAYSFLKKFLQTHFSGLTNLRILDLATGSGDLPRLAVDWARKRGISIQIDALDSHPSTLAIARERSHDYPEIKYHQHDIREAWPHQNYNLVMSFLALHHFSNDHALTVLQQMRSNHNAHCLVVDLERSRPAIVAIDLLAATLLASSMSRHDARLSIRRAFNYNELAELAVTAGWPHPQQRRVFLFRQAIIKKPE